MNQMLWSICVFLIALLILSLELFIPSAGMLGVLGGAFVIASIVLAFMSSFTAGVIMLVVACIALPVFALAALKVWPHTPIGKRILIGSVHHNHAPEKTADGLGFAQLIGQSGKATTKMLPSGMVRIAGNKYDAISESAPIDSGDSITVVSVRMNKIFVRKIDPNEPSTDDSIETSDPLSQPIDDLFSDQ